MKRYVVGFLFDSAFEWVALIRKNRPAWQAGRLNGIGGKLEPGEDSIDAMVREFREETGLHVTADRWRLMCTIAWPDDLERLGTTDEAAVDFYVAHAPAEGRAGLARLVQSLTDEQVEVIARRWITEPEWQDQLIPNITWLVPLAAYKADHYRPFVVNATVADIGAAP